MSSTTTGVTSGNSTSTAQQLTSPTGLSDSNFDEIDAASMSIREQIGNLLYQRNGGRQLTTFADAMYGIDNIKNSMYMPEMEGHGFTFITRPKLNLSPTSVRGDRILAMLDNADPTTIAFGIRAMLDTKFPNLFNIDTGTSPYFNRNNPFISILTNRLVSLNGWPDPTLDIETMEGGFFSESITYPKGSDMLARNYDLSSTFSDVQGSPIYILMLMWTRWIMLATRGKVTAYMEDIEGRRMCFTSSIYRFVMDPSNRYITKWAKATGCFPRSIPLGAFFNYEANASNVDVSMNLTIPFTVAGKVEYMDPIILREFNMLVEKSTGANSNAVPGQSSTADTAATGGIAAFPSVISQYDPSQIVSATNKNYSASMYDRMALNFRCLPYIDLSYGSNELQWRYDPADTIATSLLNTTFASQFPNNQSSAGTTTSTNGNEVTSGGTTMTPYGNGTTPNLL